MTVAGLVLDLLGVGALGWAAAIYQGGIRRRFRAAGTKDRPTEREAQILRWTERPGWWLVAGGFALQLVGVLTSPT